VLPVVLYGDVRAVAAKIGTQKRRLGETRCWKRVLRALEDERQLRADEIAERAIARVKRTTQTFRPFHRERKNRWRDSRTCRGHAVDHLRAQPI